jgi:hypothetical protein
MQSSGLDPLMGTYDLYQGNDGYIYHSIPNGASHYNTADDQLPDVVEPPDRCCAFALPFPNNHAYSTHIEPLCVSAMNQRGISVAMTTSYWHTPNQPVSALYQDFQTTEDISQLAPDIRLATSRGLDEPSERQVAIVSSESVQTSDYR